MYCAMKVTINIDCTPEEARSFMGLPDVTAVNEAMIKKMTDQVAEMTPDKAMAMWGDQMSKMTDYWTNKSNSNKG